MADLLLWVGWFVGIVSGGITLWDFSRRGKAPNTALFDFENPPPALSRESEERVLLDFDPKRKDVPGTLEHFAYSMRDAMPGGMFRDSFIDHPLGNVLAAKFALNQISTFAILLGIFALMFVGTALAKLFADPGSWLTTGLMLIGILVLVGFAARVFIRLIKNAQKALRISKEYREQMRARGILVAPQFTQDKKLFLAQAEPYKVEPQSPAKSRGSN